MGFFSKIFKSGAEDMSLSLTSPVDGKAVSIREVPDPTFGDEILGKGIAIIPQSGVVCSPCDGTIDLMFDTGHAVNLISGSGIEILIHIGLETVALKGKHFTTLRETGDQVKRGDELIRFDLDGLKADGYNTIIPIVICNSDSYSSIDTVAGDVRTGDRIITVSE